MIETRGPEKREDERIENIKEPNQVDWRRCGSETEVTKKEKKR